MAEATMTRMPRPAPETARWWPDVLIELGGAATVLVAASVFGTLLEYPGSPVHQALPLPWVRRVCMGLAMGSTALAISYSAWGRRSGAHLNPAVTLTFWRLGRISSPDASTYVAAQFAGAVAGITLASWLIGAPLAADSVHYVTTVPGRAGAGLAFAAELAISCALMLVVLWALARPHLMRYTGAFVALLVAVYISVEAPVSGTSMNPSRSFGSALAARHWMSLWVYFVAPTLGMLLAAEIHRRSHPTHSCSIDECAKMVHDPGVACRFCAYRRRRVASFGVRGSSQRNELSDAAGSLS